MARVERVPNIFQTSHASTCFVSDAISTFLISPFSCVIPFSILFAFAIDAVMPRSTISFDPW